MEETKEEESSAEVEESTPLYSIDASKYMSNEAMGFVVTEDNKHYSLTEEEFNVVVAVVAGEFDKNLNDALAVVSVILNRCDSEKWSKWAGNSPYSQVIRPGQFEVYFDDFQDWMSTENRLDQYDFDQTCINSGDFYYEDSEYGINGKYTNYNLYYFDKESAKLYFIHNNI